MMGEKGEVWVAGPDVEDANLKVVDVFTVVADVDAEESVYDRIVEFFMELPPMCLILPFNRPGWYINYYPIFLLNNKQYLKPNLRNK